MFHHSHPAPDQNREMSPFGASPHSFDLAHDAALAQLAERRAIMATDRHGLPPGLSNAIATCAIPDFTERFIAISDFLPPDAFATIRLQAEGLAVTERNFIPAHKKGGTIAYDTIERYAPALSALYNGEAMRSFVSRLVGETVHPTPARDQSSLSVLIYDRPGDHIGWHYDHNFYRGRHFTVLLPVTNVGRDVTGLSHAKLIAKLNDADVEVASPPNKLMVFEGARVLHRVTPVQAGERRVVLSMTYCADPRISTLGEAARRIKDMAFFGVRALWAGSRPRLGRHVSSQPTAAPAQVPEPGRGRSDQQGLPARGVSSLEIAN